MSENKKRSDQKTLVERRSSDAGIKSGGRRKSDHRLIEGKKSRKWFALSFCVSACILAWAFSLPFRGEESIISFGGSDKDNAELEARPVSHSADRVANDQYVQQMLALEEDLKAQLAASRNESKNSRGKDHAKSQWRKGLERRLKDVRLLAELADGEIEVGTIQWHAQQDLKEYLQDVPQ